MNIIDSGLAMCAPKFLYNSGGKLYGPEDKLDLSFSMAAMTVGTLNCTDSRNVPFSTRYDIAGTLPSSQLPTETKKELSISTL